MALDVRQRDGGHVGLLGMRRVVDRCQKRFRQGARPAAATQKRQPQLRGGTWQRRDAARTIEPSQAPGRTVARRYESDIVDRRALALLGRRRRTPIGGLVAAESEARCSTSCGRHRRDDLPLPSTVGAVRANLLLWHSSTMTSLATLRNADARVIAPHRQIKGKGGPHGRSRGA